MADRLYTVEYQTIVRARQGDRIVEMYEVHYTGPAGIDGWVRVPKNIGNVLEAADALIRRQLDEQLGIAQLGS